jgi:HK97 family phage major capsid protein
MSRIEELIRERDQKERLVNQVFEEAKVGNPDDCEYEFSKVKCLGDNVNGATAVAKRVKKLSDEIHGLNLQIEARGGAEYMKRENTIIRPPFPNTGGGKSQLGGEGYKAFPSAHGTVYEVSSEVKMADVLPSKGQAEVSIDRWLGAAMIGDRCEDIDALKFAADHQQKSLSGGTSGILLPEAFQGQWIDLLRANMVLNAAGMTTATMTERTVTTSRQLTDPTAQWRAELGQIDPSDPTFEIAQLVAKSVAVRCQGSAEIAQDSPDFGSQLMNVMTQSLGQEIDRAGLMGSGQDNEPTGIYVAQGVGSTAGVGTLGHYEPIVNGLRSLMESNVPLERIDKNAIMSPRSWATFENLREADGQPLRRPQALEKMVFRPTTSVPNNLGGGENESFIALGDFSNLVLGVRLNTTVEALRVGTYLSNLIVEFIGWSRIDFLVRRPASFHLLESITVAG